MVRTVHSNISVEERQQGVDPFRLGVAARELAPVAAVEADDADGAVAVADIHAAALVLPLIDGVLYPAAVFARDYDASVGTFIIFHKLLSIMP